MLSNYESKRRYYRIFIDTIRKLVILYNFRYINFIYKSKSRSFNFEFFSSLFSIRDANAKVY